MIHEVFITFYTLLGGNSAIQISWSLGLL